MRPTRMRSNSSVDYLLLLSQVRVSGGDGGSPNVMLQVTVSPDAAGGNSERKCGLPMSLVYSNPFIWLFSLSVQTAGATVVAVCDPAMIGQYLFLRATAANQILSICEVNLCNCSHDFQLHNHPGRCVWAIAQTARHTAHSFRRSGRGICESRSN